MRTRAGTGRHAVGRRHPPKNGRRRYGGELRETQLDEGVGSF